MKTLFTKEYYESEYDRLFKKYGNKWNFEKDLKAMIPTFEEVPEECRQLAKDIAEKSYAKEIAKRAKAELLKKAAMIKRIRNGEASLGLISTRQEAQEWFEIQEGFEFACYQLSRFKEKYGVDNF